MAPLAQFAPFVPREPPPAWREPVLLIYPNGVSARFDPRDRFLRAGDLVNGFAIDRFEIDGEIVLAHLRRT